MTPKMTLVELLEWALRPVSKDEMLNLNLEELKSYRMEAMQAEEKYIRMKIQKYRDEDDG